jgi:hypothetical protein
MTVGYASLLTEPPTPLDESYLNVLCSHLDGSTSGVRFPVGTLVAHGRIIFPLSFKKFANRVYTLTQTPFLESMMLIFCDKKAAKQSEAKGFDVESLLVQIPSSGLTDYPTKMA